MKRHFVKWMFCYMAFLVTLAFASQPIAQEKYPTGTITIMIGFGPGGGGDILFRTVADIVKKDLKVPVVVENKPGGGGALMYSLLQEAKPDGYTIGMITTSLILESHKTKGKIDYNRFDPIAVFSIAPCAITVHADYPWKTIGEFLEYARANPGKVRVGNSGTGATYHIFATMLEKKAGVKFTHVPFASGAASGTALLGKHIEAASQNLADLSASLATGKLRVLATSGEKRDHFNPDVPSLKEAGIDVVMYLWRGLGGPKGIPKERIETLEKAFLKAVQEPSYKEMMKRLMLEDTFMGNADFRKMYFRDAEVLIPILKEMEK